MEKILVGKTGAAIPTCVKAKERVGEKLKATVLKYVNAAKGKLKQMNTNVQMIRAFTYTVPMAFLKSEIQQRENLIHGDGESRSRVAGAVGFEIVSAIFIGGAGTAARAGDKAGDGGRMSRTLDKLGDIRRGIQNGFSREAKKVLSSEAAEKAAEKADDVPDLGNNTHISIQTPGKEIIHELTSNN